MKDGPLTVKRGYAWDPSWLSFGAERPGKVVTFGGVPVLAHVADPAGRERIRIAMREGRSVQGLAWEESGGFLNDELRKRERPFMDRLAPETVRSLERASYFGAYKGVTDILTKYLWPEWALVLTRWAARIGMTPNQVTLIGAILCVAATFAFYHGYYWSGLDRKSTRLNSS